MMNEKKNDELNTILRYKKSMYMDYYLSFVLFFILMIIVVMISELIRIEVEVFVFPIFLFTVSQNIVQDFIFHLSIGKRIYRLKIETNIETKKETFKSSSHEEIL